MHVLIIEQKNTAIQVNVVQIVFILFFQTKMEYVFVQFLSIIVRFKHVFTPKIMFVFYFTSLSNSTGAPSKTYEEKGKIVSH